MAEELTQNKEWIWKRAGAYKVLEMSKQGKSVPEITEAVHWEQDTVWRFMSSPTFLQRIEEHLKCVFFNFQKNKILALEEISKHLWDIAMERKQVNGLSPVQAMNHLVKILNLKDKEPKVINPKQYNIMNVFKTEPERSRDLAKEFGYADLLPEGEKSRVSPG